MRSFFFLYKLEMSKCDAFYKQIILRIVFNRDPLKIQTVKIQTNQNPYYLYSQQIIIAI